MEPEDTATLEAPVLDVARAVEPGAAENACDTTEVLVDRVEICYRNETVAACSDGSCDAPPQRDYWPLDSDRVRLYAIVWARLPDEEEFKPYCGDTGFENDGTYFRVGEIQYTENRLAFDNQSGSPAGNQPLKEFFDQAAQEKLDPAVTQVAAWPWACKDMHFDWQELVITGEASRDENDKLVRTYRYHDPVAVELHETGDDAHGWIVTPKLEKGTHRYRVALTLPEGVWRADVKKRKRVPNDQVFSRQKRGNNKLHGYNRKGMALRISVRAAAVPRARTPELTEMLQWATGFLGTPYENGGMYLGGRAKENASQAGGGASPGNGIDCNGFVEGSADLAELAWATERWRFCTWWHANKQGKSPMFPGVPFTDAEDLRPGDLLDYRNGSHVALVYDIFTDDKGVKRVKIIDSSAGKEGVALHTTPLRLDRIPSQWEMVDLSDPQPRAAEEQKDK